MLSARYARPVRPFAPLLTVSVAIAGLLAGGLTATGAAPAPAPAPRATLSLQTSAPGSHYGQVGVKITARAPGGVGKVTFKVSGTAIKVRKRLKSGRATYRMPSDLGPGTYRVKAKIRGAKAVTRVKVYNSSLTLSDSTLTLSQSDECKTGDPSLTGSIMFKGRAPKLGYVDLYKDGHLKAGQSSPDFLAFAKIDAGGSFAFSRCAEPWSKLRQWERGTYRLRAFYSPTPTYADYIYSSWVAVTVVP